MLNIDKREKMIISKSQKYIGNVDLNVMNGKREMLNIAKRGKENLNPRNTKMEYGRAFKDLYHFVIHKQKQSIKFVGFTCLV